MTENKSAAMRYIRNINYYETDNMGIVHHSNYLRYFEEARIDALDKMGLPYAEVERLGIMIPVLECECKYVKSAAFGMSLAIETTVTQFDGIRMEMSYKAFDVNNNDLIATGKTKHCFLNKNFRPVRLKKDFTNIYDKIDTIYKSCVE